MSDLTMYEVQDRDGNTVGDLWTREDYGPAKAEAKELGGFLVEHTYKFVDSGEVHDFRPKCHDCSAVLSEQEEEAHDDQCADCWASENEPQEDDLTTDDHRRFYNNGKLVVYVPEDEEWQPHVKAWMERVSFFPSVWLISDHGNAIPLSL